MMRIEFDPAKNAKNVKDRGLPFILVVDFDWTAALIVRSDRKGETRFFAIGYIGFQVYALVFGKTHEALRVISLRRASKAEVKRYEEARS
jgi:uncharacterized protein